jgi:hypothetical protein
MCNELWRRSKLTGSWTPSAGVSCFTAVSTSYDACILIGLADRLLAKQVLSQEYARIDCRLDAEVDVTEKQTHDRLTIG